MKNEVINKRAAENRMKIENSVIFIKKNLKTDIWKISYKRKYRRLQIIVIIQVNLEGLLIAYVIWNIVYLKVPIVFLNGSNHDYHFIIKELVEEVGKQFPC